MIDVIVDELSLPCHILRPGARASGRRLDSLICPEDWSVLPAIARTLTGPAKRRKLMSINIQPGKSSGFPLFETPTGI